MKISNVRNRIVILFAAYAITAAIILSFVPTVKASGDAEALAHLETLYKSYVAKYAGQTTEAGLKRITESGFDVEGDSFADEITEGYTAALTAYVFQPVEGAKDQDGLLVAARDGYVKIRAEVSKNNTPVDTLEILVPIVAKIKTVNYSQISQASEFGINNGVLESYNGSADKIIVPEGVTSIQYEWFKPADKTKVKILVLPSTLVSMAAAMCQDMTNLMVVSMGNSVETAGTYAFFGCVSLRYINLSESLSSLPEQMFRNTKSLNTLFFPAGISTFGKDCFKGSAIRDIILTNNSWTVTSYDHFKEYANIYDLPATVNALIKDDVLADRKNDLNEISKRTYTILSATTTLNDAGWDWTLGAGMVNGTLGVDDLTGQYIMVYAKSGSSLDTHAKISSHFTGKYQTLDQYHIDTVLEVRQLMSQGTQIDPEEVVSSTISEYKFKNITQPGTLQAAIQVALTGSDYTVKVEDWYLFRSVGACKDQSGVLFEGYEGFVTANIKVTGPGFEKIYSINEIIAPEMTEYNFKTTARAADFVLDRDGETFIGDVIGRDGEFYQLSKDGKTLLGYCGDAEKLIFPEGITKLDASWWLDTDLEKVRCVILPESLTELPDQFGVPFSQTVEVIIMSDNVKKANGFHTFWKCYRLKNLRLSENLENLPEEALFETLCLVDLHLPKGLKTIGKGAFHLSALRDITLPVGLQTIDQEAFAWPLRDLVYLTPEKRAQGNTITPELAEELNPYLQERIMLSAGVFIPRTITILSKDVKYDEVQSYWNTANSWIPVTIRYIPNSTTDNIIKSGYAPTTSGPYTYKELAMTAPELEMRLKNALDRVPIEESTDEDDILEFAASLIYSANVKNDMKVSGYQYTAPTSQADGFATGVLTVTHTNGTIVTVEFGRTLKFAKLVSLDFGNDKGPSSSITQTPGPGPEGGEEGGEGSPDTSDFFPIGVALALCAISVSLVLFFNKKNGLKFNRRVD